MEKIEPVEDVEGRCYPVGNVLRRMLRKRDDVPGSLAALVLEPARKDAMLGADATRQPPRRRCVLTGGPPMSSLTCL